MAPWLRTPAALLEDQSWIQLWPPLSSGSQLLVTPTAGDLVVFSYLYMCGMHTYILSINQFIYLLRDSDIDMSI